MKILIIGGTGLISCAITRFLVERNEQVVLYNRGVSDQADRQPSPAVQVIHGDRMDYATFERQMAEAGHFDCVIDMVNYLPADAESAVRAFQGRVGHFNPFVVRSMSIVSRRRSTPTPRRNRMAA